MTGDRYLWQGGNRAVGLLGNRGSSFTLAWLATHRARLHTVLLGGKRLSVLVVWDSKGSKTVPHSDIEVAALKLIVDGDE